MTTSWKPGERVSLTLVYGRRPATGRWRWRVVDRTTNRQLAEGDALTRELAAAAAHAWVDREVETGWRDFEAEP